MCNCGKNKTKRETFKVRLPGGLSVTKSSEVEARKYSAKHPGSTVVKA